MNELSHFEQELVNDAHIMVVGCGALGNEVLKDLALMGVRHLVLVDFDRVEPDNLSRSILFSRDDAAAGRYKVEAAADRLKQLNPDIEVRGIIGDIAYDVGLGLIRQMDVVIGCVDNRWARYCINRLCMRAGVPWVDGGIDGLEGTARVFRPGENCYACNLGPEGLKDLSHRMPCAGIIRRNVEAGKAPTTSIVASIIGAVEVQEAIKLVQGSGFKVQGSGLTSLCGKMFYYEGEHLTTKLLEFKAWDDDCPVHDRWEPVRPSDLTPQTTVATALQELQATLQASEVSFCLGDDCFVDFVVRRDNDSRREVMKPGRAVASFVEQDSELRGLPLSGFYQHEWREIDRTFPYQQLTLSELGIPSEAVLQVRTEGGEFYVVMGKGLRV